MYIFVVVAVFLGIGIGSGYYLYHQEETLLQNNIERVEQFESLEKPTYIDCRDVEEYNQKLELLKDSMFISPEAIADIKFVDTDKLWAELEYRVNCKVIDMYKIEKVVEKAFKN